MKEQDEYSPPIKIYFPNMVANIYTPILTPEERAKRLMELHKQAEQLLKKSKFI